MRILLADDHNLFRDALREYLERAEPDAKIFVARDIDGALKVVEAEPGLDLVLLDLRMPGVDGLEGYERIHSLNPGIDIAVMSGAANKQEIQACLDKGAVGFFPKTLSGKALLGAIKLVLSGGTYLPSGFQSAGDAAYGQPGGGPAGENSNDDTPRHSADEFNLTPREREVLSYLVQGASNKEIANSLDLQEVTVKLHVRGICRKLEAKNRTQAALRARELGLVAGRSA